MKYFKFCWTLVVLLFICSEDILAAPKRKPKPKAKPKGIKLPKINLPKINVNIHHNNIHIG